MSTPEELDRWRELLKSGRVTHVRPRQWCGWQLYAYDRRQKPALVGGIPDSPEAHAIVREAGISIEDLL